MRKDVSTWTCYSLLTTANADPRKALSQLLEGYPEYCKEYFIREFVLKCVMHWDAKKRKASAALIPLIEEHYAEEYEIVLKELEPLEDADYAQLHGFHYALAFSNPLETLLSKAYDRIKRLEKNDVGFELLSEAYLTLLSRHPSNLELIDYTLTCILCKNSELSELASNALEAILERTCSLEEDALLCAQSQNPTSSWKMSLKPLVV